MLVANFTVLDRPRDIMGKVIAECARKIEQIDSLTYGTAKRDGARMRDGQMLQSRQ